MRFDSMTPGYTVEQILDAMRARGPQIRREHADNANEGYESGPVCSRTMIAAFNREVMGRSKDAPEWSTAEDWHRMWDWYYFQAFGVRYGAPTWRDPHEHLAELLRALP